LVENSKKERIVKAAKLLFARYGFKKTTVEEICREAGIGKGTAYLHFEDKEDILREVVDEFCQTALVRLRSVVGGQSSPPKALRSFFHCKLQIVQELHVEAESNWEPINEAARVPAVEKLRTNHLEQERKLLGEVLQAGVDGGWFRIADVEHTSFVIANSRSF
jgi:AcrR family transcriptional regulator